MRGAVRKEMRSVTMRIARPVASAVMVFVLASVTTSCIDDATLPQREGTAAQTDAFRVYLDNELVMTLYEDGRVTLGPIVFIRTGTANTNQERPIRVELVDEAGNVIQNVTDARINIGTSSTATASFIREGPFTGRLRSTTTTLPATTDLIVGLYDMNQRRVAVGPFTVRITARLP